MQKALFIDRDGVINEERDYVCLIEDFEFIDGVFDALRQAQQKGYLLIVVTNQSGIGRGYYKEADFSRLTAWMIAAFENEGVHLDGVYHCPHAPDAGCRCRKPEPGMIETAAAERGIDLRRSWLVGDKESDIQAAIHAGIPHHILVRSGHAINAEKTAATHVCDTLRQAVELLD